MIKKNYKNRQSVFSYYLNNKYSINHFFIIQSKKINLQFHNHILKSRYNNYYKYNKNAKKIQGDLWKKTVKAKDGSGGKVTTHISRETYYITF